MTVRAVTNGGWRQSDSAWSLANGSWWLSLRAPPGCPPGEGGDAASRCKGMVGTLKVAITAVTAAGQ